MEHMNIAALGVSKLKWTGTEYYHHLPAMLLNQNIEKISLKGFVLDKSVLTSSYDCIVFKVLTE